MLSSASARPNWVMPWPPSGILLRHPEHRMLVGIEGDRAAMRVEIAVRVPRNRLKALSDGTNRNCISRPVASSMNTSSVHGAAAILEPAMLAAVDLHQLAIRPRGAAAADGTVRRCLRDNQRPASRHPLAQRLARHRQAVLLGQLLGRQRRAEVGVALAHQLQRLVPHAVADAVVRRAATRLDDAAQAHLRHRMSERSFAPGEHSATAQSPPRQVCGDAKQLPTKLQCDAARARSLKSIPKSASQISLR